MLITLRALRVNQVDSSLIFFFVETDSKVKPVPDIF